VFPPEALARVRLIRGALSIGFRWPSSRRLIMAIPAYLAISVVSATAQQSSSEPKPKPQNSEAVCPMHDVHSRMNERGEQGMGFPKLQAPGFSPATFGGSPTHFAVNNCRECDVSLHRASHAPC
jgi:hypothetical protein